MRSPRPSPLQPGRLLRKQVSDLFGISPAATAPLKQLTHFRGLRQVYFGSHGIVYRARDQYLARPVAIKMLPPFSNLASRERFRREAISAAAINNPHVVTVYEFVQSREGDFFVMEYVRGHRLDEIIPKNGLNLEMCLKYARQILQALAAIHSAKLILRDLKPSNVLITKEACVKLMDFGLAKWVCGDDCHTERQVRLNRPETEQGTILGTPGYMSPEQVRGKWADERSDVFSCGVMLYEMLCGQRAFCEATSWETMNAILQKTPSELPGRIPAPIRALVNRCLAKEPTKRFKNAQSLALEFQRIQDRTD